MLGEWMSELRYRCRALFRRAAMERELAEELEFHLEREMRKLVARGMAPADAARQARLAFGGMERIKDDARDARGVAPLEGVGRDLRFALRGLRTNPGFALAVILTLGLGLGANAAMFGVLDRLLFRPPPYLRDAERVHRLYLVRTVRGQERTDASTEYTRYADLARWSTAFSAAAAFSEQTVAVGSGEAAREITTGMVSGSYWSFFDARPALGRFFTASEDVVPAGAPVVVLSYPFWQTEFGGRPDVLGTTLQVGALTLEIIGVAPEGFTGISDDRPPALWMPITTFAGRDSPFGSLDYYKNYNWGWVRVLLRRKPGVSPEAASADLTSAYRRSWEAERLLDRSTAPLDVARPRAVAAPVLVERGPQGSPVGRVARWVSGVALIVLIIACANTANLLLGRALARRREFALRVALGVSRGRLVRQLLTESLLLAALGGLAGLCLAQWGGALLGARFLPEGAAPGAARDGRTLLFAALAVLAAGVLTGLVPALRAGTVDPAGTLRAGGRGSAGDHGPARVRARSFLLVLQGALSVVLLVGAGLFVRSLWNVRSLRLGYDVDPVLVVGVNLRGTRLPDEERRALVRRLRDEAAAMPGVEAAARAVSIPFWGSYSFSLHVPGIDSVRKLGRFSAQMASPEYFTVMGTRVLRGRPYTAADRAGAERVLLVSQSMAAKLWPGRDALGQCVRVRSDTMPCSRVVGIVEDIKHDGLSDDPGLQYYLPIDQIETGNGSLFVRTRGPAAQHQAAVRRHLQRLLPGSAYVTAVPLREIVGSTMRSWELGASMFLAFGVLALVVAAVGLYGVIAYSVAQRTQELGVRMALGARAAQVRRLVLGEGVRYAAAGVVLGGGIALFAGRWVAPLLFGVAPRDPVVFGVVVTAVLGVAVLASLIPAVRASRVDPATALRHD